MEKQKLKEFAELISVQSREVIDLFNPQSVFLQIIPSSRNENKEGDLAALQAWEHELEFDVDGKICFDPMEVLIVVGFLRNINSPNTLSLSINENIFNRAAAKRP